MKKLLMSAVAVVAISLSVAAQDSATTSRKPDNKSLKAAYRGDKKERKERLNSLNLTEDQKKQLKESRTEFRDKMTAIDNDKTLTEQQRNEKKLALKKDQHSTMETVLTPEQKSTLAANKMKNKEQAKEHSEKRMADMKKELALTDEQELQLKALEVSNHAKMKSIKNDSSLDEAAKKQQMEELKKSSDERRKSVLTADQMKKWDELKNDGSSRDHKGRGSKKLNS